VIQFNLRSVVIDNVSRVLKVKMGKFRYHLILASFTIILRMIIKCPECLTESERNKVKYIFCFVKVSIFIFQVMIDQAFKRDIQLLPIECSSCKWDGVLNSYQVIFHILILFLNLFMFSYTGSCWSISSKSKMWSLWWTIWFNEQTQRT